ncbi:DUF2164 domain-containing protein [Luteolibacter sp. AS25]|uniref:DUF2164 domain-containing protein n=1 Tax=Luteolibacter sp. AS25 TaxID=3135776 RepID=UPI00398AE58B
MKIQLPDIKKVEALESIQRFMSEEMDQDVSEMQAEFVLKYFMKEFAPFAYNKGIEDAQKFLLMKAEDLGGTCFEQGLTYWENPRKGSQAVRRKPGH